MTEKSKTTTADILKKLVDKKDKKDEKSNSFKFVPQDQFAHKDTLITNRETRDVENYEEFLSKELAIANIKSDSILQYNSMHIRNVQLQLLDMFKSAEDPTTKKIVKNLFNHFHVGFIAELKMTRSKKGMERRLQADKYDEIYGSGYSMPQQPAQKKRQSPLEGDIELYD